jgi:predicted dehydrogenase
MSLNRRQFLNASLAAFPYIAAPTVRGANDRLTIGFAGVGRRAQWLLKNENWSAVRIAAVADSWTTRMEEAAKLHADGNSWKRYHDYREMFDKEKFDAVFVETPTHARVLTAIHALQAGFDVYAEKPLTLTVEEGRVLRQAVRRYKRVLQTGTQQRSMPINIYASNLVASGRIGKVQKVIVCNFLAPARLTPLAAEPAPDGLNWDQWCNQTELRPYNKQLHLGWMKWWDYDGGGQSWGVSGWGTHSLDQVQAALGTSETGPVEFIPCENNVVQLRYANGTVVSLEQEIIKDHQQLGAIFEGTNGTLQILRGDFKTNRPELRASAPEVIIEGPNENSFHLQNFFDCVKSRKRPNADVEIGHRSNSVCHLVNIARDLNRPLKWNPKKERFVDDPEADRHLSRPRRAGYELPKIT